MKFLSLLFFVSALIGCAVNHSKWERAEELCQYHGGAKSAPSGSQNLLSAIMASTLRGLNDGYGKGVRGIGKTRG